MRARIRPSLLALLLIPALATCGGGTDGGEPTPAGLKVVLAPPTPIQNGVTFPLEIQVVASDGDPVDAAGIPVSLTISGGRTLNGTVMVNTGVDGLAQFTGLSITGTAGVVQITATAPDLSQVTTGNVTLAVGAPASVTIVAGDSQSAEVSKAPATGLQVQVKDAGGNNVPGAGLTLAIQAGAGSLHATTPGVVTRTVTANGSGIAALGVWRMGNLIGTNRLVVTATGFPDATAANFVATGVAGPVYYLNLTTTIADELHLALQTNYPAPYKAFARDSFNNPVAGVGVVYSLADSTLGTLTGASGVTDQVGTYTLGGFTTGTVAAVFGIHVAYTHVSLPGGGVNDITVQTRPGPFARMETHSPDARSWVRNSTVGLDFRTVDRFGNMIPFVATQATVVGGTGTLSQPEESNFAGVFSVSLNTPSAAGDVIVRAASALAPDSSAEITVHVKAPTTIISIGPDSQTVVVGDPFPAPFAAKVTDGNGDPVSEVPVSFVGNTHLTDSLGVASFSLTPSIGLYETTQVATSIWLPGDTLAWYYRTVVGPPDTLDGCCFGTIGTVGDTLAVGPGLTVRDRIGFGVPGVTVHLTTTDGTLSVADVVTDSTGFAKVFNWVLGTVAGKVRVTASVPGTTPIQLTATALPGPTDTLIILPGPAPEGFQNEPLGIGVTVQAKDRYGNGASGRSVLAVGSVNAIGSVTPIQFDSLGRAYVNAWTLGSSLITAELVLQSDSAELGFTAAVLPRSPFDIQLRGVPAEFQPVFRSAAYRWRKRVVADIPDLPNVTIAGGQCAGFQQAVNGTVDDLIIDVNIGGIDGPGGILGGATPCFVRTGTNLPLLGVMQFDIADLEALQAGGTLGDVILHEMGHVLGVGSLWSLKGLVSGAGTPNPQYLGAGGNQGWVEIGGNGLGVTNVPVENTGGSGTRDVHWRESVMPSELMTGFLSALVNPMSAVTVRSLQDLGYTVDASAADAYTVQTAPSQVPGRPAVRIQDLVGRPQFTIAPDGTITPLP